MTTPSTTPAPTLPTDWVPTESGCFRTDDYWIWDWEKKKDRRTVLGGPWRTTDCFASEWEPDITYAGSGCPAQYTSACGGGSDASDTAVTCCPSVYNFVCQTDVQSTEIHANWFRCISQYTSQDVVRVTRTNFEKHMIGMEKKTRSTRLHLFALALMYTPPPSTTPPSTISSPTSSPSSPSSQSSSTMATPTPSTEPSSSGLGAGAAAGIGVGVGVAIILLSLLAWFIYRRRRARAGVATASKGSAQFLGPGGPAAPPPPPPPPPPQSQLPMASVTPPLMVPTPLTHTTDGSRGPSHISGITPASASPSPPPPPPPPPPKELPANEGMQFELEGDSTIYYNQR